MSTRGSLAGAVHNHGAICELLHALKRQTVARPLHTQGAGLNRKEPKQAISTAPKNVQKHAPYLARAGACVNTKVSTRGSLAGAVRACGSCCRGRRCFNSRLPCGSRPAPTRAAEASSRVSTRGSLAGAVAQADSERARPGCFNSRLPCGSRRAAPPKWGAALCGFNSRLPCGSRRPVCRARLPSASSFNSRLPCGSRQPTAEKMNDTEKFQLAAPLREPS